MKKPSKISPKFLISGGGTGGHIFPAIAIADELKNRFPNAEFLFIGANDKMEMEKIPKAGYNIKGLWISGIERKNILKNLSFPFKLISSIWKCKKYIQTFQPDFAIGTGGFASGPAIWTANQQKIPFILQEQNSFPGITNKFLKDSAKAICVAYDGMEQYFPKDKIQITGNPVRNNLLSSNLSKEEAKKHFNLNLNKFTILSIGGSLGSSTLNNGWLTNLNKISEHDIQLIWQTGKLEYEKISEHVSNPNISVNEFIYEMGIAFQAADIIVSRAGAIAISELCLAGKPTILVPFPYAAEDHQTKNAENLVSKNAAFLLKDPQVNDEIFDNILKIKNNLVLQEELSKNIKQIGKPNATNEIVDIIEKILYANK